MLEKNISQVLQISYFLILEITFQIAIAGAHFDSN